MYKKILVPVDLAEKEMTQLALAAASPIARANAAELRLVNIQPIVPVSMIDYIPPNFDDELRQTAEKELAEMIGHVDYPSAQRSSTRRWWAAGSP